MAELGEWTRPPRPARGGAGPLLVTMTPSWLRRVLLWIIRVKAVQNISSRLATVMRLYNCHNYPVTTLRLDAINPGLWLISNITIRNISRAGGQTGELMSTKDGWKRKLLPRKIHNQTEQHGMHDIKSLQVRWKSMTYRIWMCVW